MAKFIFICRCCGKKFKQKANTLQSARRSLLLKVGGELVGDDQGIICGDCYDDDKEYSGKWRDRGTYVEENY